MDWFEVRGSKFKVQGSGVISYYIVSKVGQASRLLGERASASSPDCFDAPRQAGETPALLPGKTIIAGYPWFTDWGRDIFIVLRGLCQATGRLDDAHDILLAWASAVSEGMLPNRFPDRGEQPEYNAVDASLWFIIAVHEYLTAAGVSPDDHPGVPPGGTAVRAINEWDRTSSKAGRGLQPPTGSHWPPSSRILRKPAWAVSRKSPTPKRRTPRTVVHGRRGRSAKHCDSLRSFSRSERRWPRKCVWEQP